MRDKRVAILESRLGPQMVDLIAKRGGIPVHAPALAEVPDVDPAHVRELIDDLSARPARISIFQTGVGTRALFGVRQHARRIDGRHSGIEPAREAIAAHSVSPVAASSTRSAARARLRCVFTVFSGMSSHSATVLTEWSSP